MLVAARRKRSGAPLGDTRRLVFACMIAPGGEAARFDVRVLADGCFAAERRRPGRAVYGCGVR
jgi:hypothetical protein